MSDIYNEDFDTKFIPGDVVDDINRGIGVVTNTVCASRCGYIVVYKNHAQIPQCSASITAEIISV